MNAEATFNIVMEPRGEGYRNLIAIIAAHSNSFLLVQRDQIALDASGHELLRQLGPFMVRQERASMWPGTCLQGYFALLSWFRVAEQSIRAITVAVDGLYGWQQPAMPEDLCFFGPDEGLLFASIAHESDAWVTSTKLAEALQAALGTSYFEGAV